MILKVKNYAKTAEDVKNAMDKAVEKYQYLQTETVFIEYYRDTYLINWHHSMDRFISMHRVKQIAKFLYENTGCHVYCKGGYKLTDESNYIKFNMSK